MSMKRVVAAKLRLGYLFSLLPLLLLVCFISSCLQIDYYVTINRDGSESVTAKVAAIKEIKLDRMENMLKSHGYNTAREIRNDSIYLIATQIFPAGKWAIPYPYGMVKDSIKLAQSYTNYYLFTKYKISATYILDSSKVENFFTKDDNSAESNASTNDSLKNMNGALLVIPVRYHIHVPGRIDTTTATNILVDTLNWNYKLKGGENVNIICASTEYNYTYLIILGLLIVAFLFYVFKGKDIKTN
jgi:hypothetical protein